MDNGYFKLHRKFFDHWLWLEDREMSRADAFLDLLQLAAFVPTQRLVANEVINVPRGGIVATERFLSGRWKWSRTKVRHFLGVLESQRMIRYEKNHGKTLFLLCNYAKWNPPKDHIGTKEEPKEDQIEEGKEGEKGEARAREGSRIVSSSELPDEKEALITAVNSGVDKTFALYAWEDFASRNGKDAAGVVLPWLAYVRKRWTREQAEWKNGTHKGRKLNGHTASPPKHDPADAELFEKFMAATYPTRAKDIALERAQPHLKEEFKQWKRTHRTATTT